MSASAGTSATHGFSEGRASDYSKMAGCRTAAAAMAGACGAKRRNSASTDNQKDFSYCFISDRFYQRCIFCREFEDFEDPFCRPLKQV